MSGHPMADAFRHHVWATVRLLDACSGLTDEHLATTVPGTYGSIIDTLRHLVGGDVLYLDVLRGGVAAPFDEASRDVAMLRATMAGNGAAWDRVLADTAGMDPATDVVEVEAGGYETHAPLGIRLAQALYHGADHRSQVCTALTALGIEPPSLEVWDFASLDGRMRTIESASGCASGSASGSAPERTPPLNPAERRH